MYLYFFLDYISYSPIPQLSISSHLSEALFIDILPKKKYIKYLFNISDPRITDIKYFSSSVSNILYPYEE